MNSRVTARLMVSATLGCSIATAGSTVATAQFFRDPDAGANPFQRLFGFRSSPIPRSLVNLPGPYRPGTVVISTSARRLYLVTAPGQALSYGIGVGRIGFTWAGIHTVSMKREWPDWTPPSQMLRRRPDLVGAVMLLLSSPDRQGDSTRCRCLGIEHHLTKPVKPSDLLAHVTALLNPGAAPSPAAPPRRPASAPRLRRRARTRPRRRR